MLFRRKRARVPDEHWEMMLDDVRIVGRFDGAWSFRLLHDYDLSAFPDAPHDGPYEWRYLAEAAAAQISEYARFAASRRAS